MVALPHVKPSAIAIGTAFNHLSGYIVTAPVIGAACKRAKDSNTPEEFVKSREAATAASVWGGSLLSSAVQSYALSVLLQKTGVTTIEGASIVGGLVFAVSSLPEILTHAIVNKQPIDQVLASTATSLIDTVGLAAVLTWWGFRELTL